MNQPRVIIAGVSSGVGKTSISIGIMKGLMDRGYRVQGFKVGPDYIDPSYHTSVTGRASRNLDPWLMGEDGLMDSFFNAMRDADVAVIEGVMGMYDGLSGKDDYGSTAYVASILNSPVILVVDAAKSARSVAAVALGFMRFSDVNICGIILNNIASDRHAEYCRDAVEGLGIPLLGMVKRNRDLTLDERHLGLIPTYESSSLYMKAREVAGYIKDSIDIDAIIDILRQSSRDSIPYTDIGNKKDTSEGSDKRLSVCVALDESFNFYYADNIDMLRRYANVIFFSPVNDRDVPECDMLYIGGGFPEVLAPALSGNPSMLKKVKHLAEDGMPIYAECGGLMYLSRCIEYNGSRYDMVGVIDAYTSMGKGLTLNYTEARAIRECCTSHAGMMLRGHEFHYSNLEVASDTRFAYEMRRGKGIDGTHDGALVYSTLASYMHIHFAHKGVVECVLKACSSYRRR
jgi:cobyrinic acid a,c-diamide synthase